MCDWDRYLGGVVRGMGFARRANVRISPSDKDLNRTLPQS